MIADMKRELGELAVQSQALSDAYLLEKRNGYLYIGMGQMNIKSLLGLKRRSVQRRLHGDALRRAAAERSARTGERGRRRRMKDFQIFRYLKQFKYLIAIGSVLAGFMFYYVASNRMRATRLPP